MNKFLFNENIILEIKKLHLRDSFIAFLMSASTWMKALLSIFSSIYLSSIYRTENLLHTNFMNIVGTVYEVHIIHVQQLLVERY